MAKNSTIKYSLLSLLFNTISLILLPILLFCACYFVFASFGKEEILAELFQQMNLQSVYTHTVAIITNAVSVELNKSYALLALINFLIMVLSVCVIFIKTIKYTKIIKKNPNVDIISVMEDIASPGGFLKFFRTACLILLTLFVAFQLLYPSHTLMSVIEAKALPYEPDFTKLLDIRLLSFLLTICPFGLMLWKTNYDNARELVAHETHALIDDWARSDTQDELVNKIYSYNTQNQKKLKYQQKLFNSLSAATWCCFFINIFILMFVQNSVVALILNTLVSAVNAAVNKKTTTYPLEESRNMYKRHSAYWHSQVPGHSADWNCGYEEYEPYHDYLY